MQPSVAISSAQPPPSSQRPMPTRMPGIETPSAADNIHTPSAISAINLTCARARSAACRRKLGAERSSARRRSASNCALEIHPDTVAIERFFQCRDDHAGQPRLEVPEHARTLLALRHGPPEARR